MSWKPHFERGIALFKGGQHEEALEQFNQALANGGENQFILYDSRAAIYEKLNNPKDALRDAKTTIKLAPQRWQGYARAARLFMKTHKFDASLKMIDHALAHVKPEDHSRRNELSKLKQDITSTQETLAERERRMQNHMAKLPIEIYGEIFQMVLAEDYAQIVTLLHICAHWRQVIWDSPGLWHTLVLSKRRADRKALLWLERSRGRIRELHVLQDYVSKEAPGRPSFFDDIDWSHLRAYRIHNPELFDYIDSDTMLCDLERAEIDARGTYLANTFFHKSDKLKSLSILRATLQPGPLYTSPFLTNLHLADCFLHGNLPDDFVAVLCASPQLESLHLENLTSTGFVRTPRDQDDLEEIGDLPVFDNLKTLEIIRSSWTSFILLLSLPALQTLRLEGLKHEHLNEHILVALSSRSSSLKEISLKDMAVHPVLPYTILRLTPTLEVLALVGMYKASNEVINILVEEKPKDGLVCLCPRLRHLDVSNCPDVQTSTLHALVKQRLALSAIEVEADGQGDEGSAPTPTTRVSKLEVLKMDGCPGIDVAWVPWFREHVAEVSCIYASASSQKGKRGVARRVNGL